MEALLRPRSHQSSHNSSHSSTHNPRYGNADPDSWALASPQFEYLAGTTSAVLQQDTLLSMNSPVDYHSVGNVPGGHHSTDEQDRDVHAPFPAADADNTSPNSAQYSDASQSIIPQHYGPGYWLSLCSPAGLAWVQQHAGLDDFAGIAEELTASWTKLLRLERQEPTLQSAEPQTEVAWKYCNAYFEQSVDSIFDVVHRPEFEHYLRAHLSGRYQNEDPTWYALRNVVYASGCRLYQSENPAASFTNTQREAWSYFSNSLSVHSELLLRSPSLRSVRALLAMALFVEGPGCPALGSGLIANAALLARSLNLHRNFSAATRPTESEVTQRSWLFWAVYCCEKNIARRSGRPSVIDDEDVSCEIPSAVHVRSTINVKLFTYIIQTCQISSLICRELLSAKTHDEQPDRMLEIVMRFDRQLRSWKESFPSQLRPKDYFKEFQPPSKSMFLPIILIHCSYYDLLMVIHSFFTYPWITNSFSPNLKPQLRAKLKSQIMTSSNAVVDAARNIIVMSRHFHINGACTYAFLLHYPMHAFINLFVHTIRFPRIDTVRSDLALLDVAAGYFGQMDFVTGSKLSFPFARDIAALARDAVDGAHHSAPATVAAESSRRQLFDATPIPTLNQSQNRTQTYQAEEFDFGAWIV